MCDAMTRTMTMLGRGERRRPRKREERGDWTNQEKGGTRARMGDGGMGRVVPATDASLAGIPDNRDSCVSVAGCIDALMIGKLPTSLGVEHGSAGTLRRRIQV